MSGALGKLFALGSNLAGPLSALNAATGLLPTPIAALLRAPRKIGTIVPDCTIEEHFSDRVVITQHPVADNTPMSDHAYRMPGQITMRIGFSNSNPITAAAGGLVSDLTSGASIGTALGNAGSSLLSSFTEQRCNEVYQSLIKLQQDRDMFKLTAGKGRSYQSVLITELAVTNDHRSEYALMIEVHMQEVMTVKTETTSQPSLGDQGMPQRTAQPTDQGTQQPTPTAPSGPPQTYLRQLGAAGGIPRIGY
jgi:hypothetical protein